MRICPQWTYALYGTLEPGVKTHVLCGAVGVERWNKVGGIQNFGVVIQL